MQKILINILGLLSPFTSDIDFHSLNQALEQKTVLIGQAGHKRKRFHDKIGPPGHTFQHSTSQKQQEMYHFPVEWKIFQVHMPLFWVWSSTANFWKTSKKNNILNVKSVNPSCNITK